MNNLIKDLDLYDINPLEIVYQLLINDNTFINYIGGKERVFKYHVPEEYRKTPPIIRLNPIIEKPAHYADNEQLAWNCIVQVDVWDISDSRSIALKVNKLMKEINFKQDTPVFEFDPDTYLVRDARRYRGTLMSKLKENE